MISQRFEAARQCQQGRLGWVNEAVATLVDLPYGRYSQYGEHNFIGVGLLELANERLE